MTYHHVIAKAGSEDKFRTLFSNLSAGELRQKFIRPYEDGLSFFSGNDLVSPSDLRSVQIVRTARQEEVERDALNKKSLEKIDDINRSGSVILISTGSGYDPEDIAEAGEDVTHAFIQGPPGYKASRWVTSIKAIGWVGGIIAAVTAAGIIKWLGWV